MLRNQQIIVILHKYALHYIRKGMHIPFKAINFIRKLEIFFPIKTCKFILNDSRTEDGRVR